MLFQIFSLKSLLFLTLLFFIAPINGASAGADPDTDPNPARKLDETPVTNPNECTPCTQNPPPPPPVYPSPPPPSPPPPDVVVYYSPPPPKKKEPKNNCPPPPTPSFMYITGPPGDLYPIDNNYNKAGRRIAAGLPAVIGCGLLAGLLMI